MELQVAFRGGDAGGCFAWKWMIHREGSARRESIHGMNTRDGGGSEIEIEMEMMFLDGRKRNYPRTVAGMTVSFLILRVSSWLRRIWVIVW
jgi:hypothetical protein